MKLPALFALLLYSCVLAHAQDAPKPKEYPFGPDSERKEGVPQGKVTKQVWKSTVFPGTIRECFVYVPAQYDPQGSEKAAVMIFQDGHAYVDEKGQVRVPVVLDNLIAANELPVMIGIFINPGWFAEELKEAQKWKAPQGVGSNRSVEYDSLDAKYAEFLEKEILAEVGKTLRLTDDPDQRAICGMSSGGICAFTVAWERPDLFRKVLSHIGSFTNIRGGHVYPSLIRKEKIRPLRVFLQDGTNDLDNEHGNWFLANQQMAAALKFRHYDYTFVTDDSEHGGKGGGKIFADSVKWLWRK